MSSPCLSIISCLSQNLRILLPHSASKTRIKINRFSAFTNLYFLNLCQIDVTFDLLEILSELPPRIRHFELKTPLRCAKATTKLVTRLHPASQLQDLHVYFVTESEDERRTDVRTMLKRFFKLLELCCKQELRLSAVSPRLLLGPNEALIKLGLQYIDSVVLIDRVPFGKPE